MPITSVSHQVENLIRGHDQYKDKPIHMWIKPPVSGTNNNASLIVECDGKHTNNLFYPSNSFNGEVDKNLLRNQYRFRIEAIYLDNELISQRSWRDYYDEVTHMHRNYWLGIKYHRKPNQAPLVSVVFGDGTQRCFNYNNLVMPSVEVYWYERPFFDQTRIKRQEYDVELTVLTDRELPKNTLSDPSGVPLSSTTREMLQPYANTAVANYFRNLLAEEDKLVTAYNVDIYGERLSEYKRFIDPIKDNRDWLYEEFKKQDFVEVGRAYNGASTDLWWAKKDSLRTLISPFSSLYLMPQLAERIYEDHGLVVHAISNVTSSSIQNNDVLQIRGLMVDDQDMLAIVPQRDAARPAAKSITLYFEDRDIGRGDNLHTEVEWLAYRLNSRIDTPNQIIVKDTFGQQELQEVHEEMLKDHNIGRHPIVITDILKANNHANEVLFRHDLKRILEAYGWTNADVPRAVEYGSGVTLDGWQVEGSYVSWRKPNT